MFDQPTAIQATERDLAARIDQLLTSLPQECETWGGRAALSDYQTVEAILREVDPPKG